MKFHEMGITDRILEAIARLRWSEPTPIQEKAIPFFLGGRDILARARTGSGKTGAFLVPLIHKILERKEKALSQVTSTLILAPTKELCKQISEHIEQLTVLCKREVTFIDLSPQVPIEAQKPLLADQPDIIIGTPLKVLVQLNEGNILLKNSLQFLIIDEADLMFAYEHEKELKSILKKLPSLYQSFITSATLPTDVKALKTEVLHNPVILHLEEPPLPAASQLTQYVIMMEEFEKAILVCALLRMDVIKGKTLIFVNSVGKGYKLRMFLSMFDVKSCILNSELPVNSRCHIIDEFNRGKYRIMIASDEKTVTDPTTSKNKSKKRFSKWKKDRESGVSRGIDFKLVANVVNFDFPVDSTAYVHRVGRTARGVMQGTALSFVASSELKTFKVVEEDLQELLSEKSVFKEYKFNMASLDGFRYRASDAWMSCTSAAIRDVRRKELKIELLNSQKLKAYFEDHPKDINVIRNIRGKSVAAQPHLRHVPEYNIPSALRRVASSGKINKKIFSKANKSYKKTKKKEKSQDPLRTMKFAGFSQ